LGALLASGCGGEVAGNGSVDASSGAARSGEATVNGSRGSGEGGWDDDSGSPGPSLDGTAPPVDSGSCSKVVASDYDQTCTTFSDCVSVAEIPSCPVLAGSCFDCPLATINGSAEAAYMAAFSRDIRGVQLGDCHCPGIAIPCCRNGMCHNGCGPVPADTLPECRDAGGSCGIATTSGCASGTTGPPDACAYSYEICCVP
jgi:hypothetical protein